MSTIRVNKFYTKPKKTLRTRRSRVLSLTGFTLVEILMALVILGIGLVSILSLFALGVNSVRKTVSLTEASFIARMTFSRCNAEGYDNLRLGGLDWTIRDSQGNQIYADYSRTVTPQSVLGVTNLYEVSVDVQGNGINETFRTYIAKQNP